MDLKEIFKETLEMYPKNIDISDGELILHVGGEGFYSTNFVSIYGTVEIKAELKGEWYSLFAWVISQVLHEKVKKSFKKNIMMITRKVDQTTMLHYLNMHLVQEYYRDMREEFLKYSKDKGTIL